MLYLWVYSLLKKYKKITGGLFVRNMVYWKIDSIFSILIVLINTQECIGIQIISSMPAEGKQTDI